MDLVGFARVVTDYVTFGYLTDVYVLEGHQGKGLGVWLMECLDDIISGWPRLRGFLLLTSGSRAISLYEKTIGAKTLAEAAPHLTTMMKKGPGIAVKKE